MTRVPKLVRWSSPVATLLLVLLWPQAAPHADVILDIAGVVDTISVGAPGALPFTGDDIRTYHDIIEGCQNSGGGDDVVACIDAASASPAAQENGVPSWFPQMLEVYFDVKHNDFWGLLEDAGEAAACAAATVITDGIDICGGIQYLINAAKEIASDAKAVGKFFADLGADLASGAKAVYCFFFGCSDSGPPPPPPQLVAYQNFFFPLISEGLAQRLFGAKAWQNYAGPTYSSANPSVVDKGLKAGYGIGALNGALPSFQAAVYAQWDVKIVTDLAPAVRKVAANWSAPQNVHDLVAQAEENWDDSELGAALSDAYLGQNGHAQCVNALVGAGGPQVDAWIVEGQNQQASFSGFKWPASFKNLCDPFDQLFAEQFGPYVQARAAAYWSAHCIALSNSKLGPITYDCKNDGAAQACQTMIDQQGPNAPHAGSVCVDITGKWDNPKAQPSGGVQKPPPACPHGSLQGPQGGMGQPSGGNSGSGQKGCKPITQTGPSAGSQK